MTTTTRTRIAAALMAAGLVPGLALTAGACGSDDSGGGSKNASRSAAPSIDGAARQRATNALTTALPQIRTTISVVPGMGVPGMSVASDLPNTGMVTVPDGMTDVQQQTPVTADTEFHIGSESKTFTAALIMQLDQERRLSIDDPISKYVTYPGGAGITVRQLLSHTSGIPDLKAVPALEKVVATITPAETVKMVGAKTKPMFTPGTSFFYSNTNYLLLGLIAEKVTGNAWDKEVRRRFFEPFGLRHTWVYGYEKAPAGARMATGYEAVCVDKACTKPKQVKASPDMWKFAWAAGGVVSTPRDMATWLRALIVGDVLDRKHRTMMQTPTPQSEAYLKKINQKGALVDTGYGLGLFHYDVQDVGTGWGHSGTITGFNSEMVYIPDRRFAFALQVNANGNLDPLTKGTGAGPLMADVVKAAD